ncbi:MAG: hypothetical protein RBS02_00105 [Steroidobacteraceae bacterium]|nr:hypothetical protein [Steroidobacteraceae bacterium]
MIIRPLIHLASAIASRSNLPISSLAVPGLLLEIQGVAVIGEK